MPRLLLIAAASYLFGSIPFGYLLVRIMRGEDIRASGSGNIGTTNVSRKSPALGVFTLVLDALKGSSAVAFAYFISGRMGIGPTPYSLMALAALCAVAGHVFPVWLGFRGGKGVATGLGSFLLIVPQAVLIAIIIFVIIVLAFRYVSLGSIVSVAVFPVVVWILHQYGDSASALIYMALASALIVAKHHENISRLMNGTENRLGAKHV